MTFTRKRLILLAAAPLALAGSLAVAQPAPPAPAPDAPAPAAQPAPGLFQHGGRHGGRGHDGFGGRDAFRGLFEEVDADADGRVTEAEVTAFRDAQLTAADTSGDGAVSLDEFATVYFARIRPQMVDAFQAFDDDGDGSITSAELEDRFGDVVSRFDRNEDGVLSPEDRPRRDRR
jgi:Ca2+-binding EF-hand superfamily protein